MRTAPKSHSAQEAPFATLRPPWHADALCREHPDLPWLPRNGQNTAPAKALCGSCLVRDECLADAIANEEIGIWGGTSTEERLQLQRHAAFDAGDETQLRTLILAWADHNREATAKGNAQARSGSRRPPYPPIPRAKSLADIWERTIGSDA